LSGTIGGGKQDLIIGGMRPDNIRKREEVRECGARKKKGSGHTAVTRALKLSKKSPVWLKGNNWK